MDDSMKQIAIRADEEYGLALRIARKHWHDGTPPEVVQAAAATVLIHLKGLRVVGNGDQHEPPAPTPPCEKCGGPMWDNRGSKKNSRSPDLKCKDPACDHAVWLRKKGAKP